MTANVRGLRAGVHAVARAIGDVQADVVLLQETGPRLGLYRLAAMLRMHAVGDPWAFPRRRVKNAVLVRMPLRPGLSRFRRFAHSARFYPRGVATTEVVVGGIPVLFASVHLGLQPAERLRHVRELLPLLPSVASGRAVVLGGDLNELPDGRAVALLTARFREVWAKAVTAGRASGQGFTFPSAAPSARIDQLFVSNDVEVKRARVPDEPEIVAASDHLPLVADLAIEGTASSL
jgi:endonuclease/exonuclease/phosphatase family metal-dependent hydrolase